MAIVKFSLSSSFLLLSSLCILAKQAFGDYGGWQSAHATFYGGSDASGTMGIYNIITKTHTVTLLNVC
jgi:hypothetical protein